MLDRLLDVFAPHICCSCGRQNALLCEYCHYDIVSEAFHRCIVCLKPTVDTNLCSRCRPAAVYDDAWCVNERSDGLKELIDRYKFDRARAGAAILASPVSYTHLDVYKRQIVGIVVAFLAYAAVNFVINQLAASA